MTPDLAIPDARFTAADIFTIAWSAVIGRTYRVQSKQNLEGAIWTDVSGAISATRTTLAFHPSAREFHRLVQIQ
jgi:hypothetical protein